MRLCHKLISEKNFCSAKFEKMLDNISCRCYNFLQRNGLVAQLGERCVRNAEVKGSNPSRSTKKGTPPKRRFSFLQRRGSKRAVVNEAPVAHQSRDDRAGVEPARIEPLQVHQKRNTAEKAVFFFAKEGSKRAVVNDVPFGTSEPLDPKASSLRESSPSGEHRLPPVTVS